MRLLCFGDVHLGAGSDYGAAPGDRLGDQRAVLSQIAHEAERLEVDAVLFAGDAFERRTQTPLELTVWRGFRDQLAEEKVPMFSIAGNHDVAARMLQEKLGWADYGTLVGGGLPDGTGNCYVMVKR